MACTTKVMGMVAKRTQPNIPLHRLKSSNAPVDRMIRVAMGIIAMPKIESTENQ